MKRNEARIQSIALLGSPNVGKSALFNALTSTYVTVSNYPGTTVEIYHGAAQHKREPVPSYRYAGNVLTASHNRGRAGRALPAAEKQPDIILHVIDAKNIERMLPFTLQLIEAGFR